MSAAQMTYLSRSTFTRAVWHRSARRDREYRTMLAEAGFRDARLHALPPTTASARGVTRTIPSAQPARRTGLSALRLRPVPRDHRAEIAEVVRPDKRLGQV